MLETPQDITNAVNAQKTNTQRLKLKDRFESDYELWRLEKYQLGKKGEYDNYTSNSPRTLANKVVEVLSNAPVQIRIPLEGPEVERTAINTAERFVYGCLNLADSRLQAMGLPSTQEQLAFLSTLRGWYAIRAFVRKNKQRETIPDIAIWDIMHTYWEVGSDGLLWVCHARPITRAQAKSQYNLDENNDVVAYDFWDDTYNAVVINNVFVKPRKKHGLKYPPVLIANVGSVPLIQSERFTDTLKDVGESIYGSDRNLYDTFNKLKTYYLTLIGQGVHNPIAVSSKGGKKTLEKSPYYKGSVTLLDSELGEAITPIFQPVVPRDAGILLADVGREISMGGMSPISFGELNFQLPAYGINLLTSADASVLSPRQRAIEKGIEWIARELLTQYKAGGFKKLRIHGRDGSNEYFDMTVGADDIKGDWFPEVKLLPSLPEDTASKYAMAQQAVVSELLSKETARDKLLGVQDPDRERQKILREKAWAMPPIILRTMIAALVKEEDYELAQILQAELDKMVMGAMPPGGKERPAGMPPYVVSPEEATGKMPPATEERLEAFSPYGRGIEEG